VNTFVLDFGDYNFLTFSFPTFTWFLFRPVKNKSQSGPMRDDLKQYTITNTQMWSSTSYVNKNSSNVEQVFTTILILYV
jgi:hypothetical protein